MSNSSAPEQNAVSTVHVCGYSKYIGYFRGWGL